MVPYQPASIMRRHQNARANASADWRFPHSLLEPICEMRMPLNRRLDMPGSGPRSLPPSQSEPSIVMSLVQSPRPPATDTAVAQPTDAVLWLHPAFCSLALPLRATRGAWQRGFSDWSVRIEPSSNEDAVPNGRILRLSLIHICDAAFRSKSPLIELGETAAMLANILGVDPKTRDLTDQWQRLQAARVMVVGVDGAEVSVFDARSRRRAGDGEWRSGVRLSSKFVSSLKSSAVALNRHVVGELSASPAALDVYAWISLSLNGATVDQVVTTTWEDLLQRFGTASQGLAEFRTGFEGALRLVFEVESSIDLAVDDDGISVRRVEAAVDETAPDSAAPTPPAAGVSEVAVSEPPEQPAIVPSATSAPEAAKPASLPQHHSSAPHVVKADREAAVGDAFDRIIEDSISLSRQLTGLAQVVWLRRGPDGESALVGVTPSPRFELERLTILAVEPMVLQVSGGLNEKDFERVSAWVMTNRDVIDEFWEGGITSFAEMNRRVRKVPTQGLR
jgi:hypothetical protein